MSISPMRPVGYAAPVPPPAPRPLMAPAQPVAYMTATTARPGVGAVVHAAMTGQALPGASAGQAKLLSMIQAGQTAMGHMARALMPPKVAPVQVASTMSLGEQAKKVARAAVFFALPVGGAAAVACGLGWAIGPLVPFVGGHVFGAVAGALLIGQTAGMLLHGVMRMPLITSPEDRELNSAGATAASALLGAGFAGAIALAAGNPVTLPIVLAGAAVGAIPRLMEWSLGKL